MYDIPYNNMKHYIIALSVFLISCSDIQEPQYNAGKMVTLNDGRKVIIEQQIPSGYIVYVPNKMEIKFFQITPSEIKK